MLEKFEQNWQEFREDAPGERFQKRFERRHQSRPNPFQKILFMGGGILVMAAGLFFLPAPGPGTVILLIGAALVAQESLTAARLLDRAEVFARKIADRSRQVWRGLPVPAKILLVLLAAALLAAAAWGAYRVLFAA